MTQIKKQSSVRPLTRPADCAFYPDEQGCDLAEDFPVVASDGKTYVVPSGFWFNGGSIPSFFWQLTFTPFDQRVIDAFLFHDWAYTSHVIDKRVADDTLQAFIRDKNMSAKAWAVARAVRWFGDSSWKHTAVDAQYLRQLTADIRASGRDEKLYGIAA
ncbi:MAG: DUF1353 domain-containing protein [Pseudomonadales bacterium]|nr:DUF1353 domain-containing protein [Pseudomonadales bacterium]